MAESAATSLSFLPVAMPWQEAFAKIVDYLGKEHEPHRGPSGPMLLQFVDPRQCRSRRVEMIDPKRDLGPEPPGVQYWRSVSTELRFGKGNDTTTVIHVREVGPLKAEIELWFATNLRFSMLAHDDSGREIDPSAKSDFVRLCIDIAKLTGSAGFGYQLANDDSIFGPPNLEELRMYVEDEISHADEEQMLLVAAIAADHVDQEKFIFDVEYPKVHYRQDSYYLYDMLWPVNAFKLG